MALPPGWKVKRELNRIVDKTGAALGRWIHDPVRKPIYDLTALWRQRVTPGAFALTDRVVVFVVYQPKGIAPSILLTLDHLRQNLYSVLVVSNGPLRPEDRATLAQNAALVLERPNVGYDFGAYRDGIRHLWSLNHDMSRLVLMNDSTWFPLRRDDDSLTRMEALQADLAGHIFKTEERRMGLHDHIESHLVMISSAFLASDDFRNFWNDYRMSDRRATTIAQGEKGFSQCAIRSGWTVKALMGRDWLVDCLNGLSEDELLAVLKNTADDFPARMENSDAIRRAAANGENWRQRYVDWVHDCLSNTNSFVLSGAFIMPAMLYGRLGFLKKGRDVPFHHARRALLALEREGTIPPLDRSVQAEVLETVRKWVPPKETAGPVSKRETRQLPVRG
ncbi:MAG: rhamnan synthesis F family protein [Tabrizicola sp.]